MRFLADENLHREIVRGLQRILPSLDIKRVQDVGLIGVADPIFLEYAATELRVLVTHDVTTITKYAYDRVTAGLPMPGVIEVKRSLSVGEAVADLELIVTCMADDEFRDRVVFVPL